jgi:mRNA interferase MazF
MGSKGRPKGRPFFLVQVDLHPAFTWGERMPEQTPQKPPWVRPRIIAAPKIRQIYWCDFWKDAHLPEMWKTRPVIVVSYKNTLHGPCLVIPTTTEPDNETNPWACKLSIKVEGANESWAICNQPSTVAPSRFSQFKGKIPLLPKEDL